MTLNIIINIPFWWLYNPSHDVYNMVHTYNDSVVFCFQCVSYRLYSIVCHSVIFLMLVLECLELYCVLRIICKLSKFCIQLTYYHHLEKLFNELLLLFWLWAKWWTYGVFLFYKRAPCPYLEPEPPPTHTHTQTCLFTATVNNVWSFATTDDCGIVHHLWFWSVFRCFYSCDSSDKVLSMFRWLIQHTRTQWSQSIKENGQYQQKYTYQLQQSNKHITQNTHH
jgi:hypothetical protein